MVHDVEGHNDELTVTVHNNGYGPLIEGTLSIAGTEISLPEIVPGGIMDVNVRGHFQEGPIPVSAEWKKRIHPMSPDAERDYEVTLVEDNGLQMEAVAMEARPNMDALLVDPTLAQQDPVDLRTESEDTPAGILPFALLFLVALAVRRQQ